MAVAHISTVTCNLKQKIQITMSRLVPADGSLLFSLNNICKYRKAKTKDTTHTA